MTRDQCFIQVSGKRELRQAMAKFVYVTLKARVFFIHWITLHQLQFFRLAIEKKKKKKKITCTLGPA